MKIREILPVIPALAYVRYVDRAGCYPLWDWEAGPIPENVLNLEVRKVVAYSDPQTNEPLVAIETQSVR